MKLAEAVRDIDMRIHGNESIALSLEAMVKEYNDFMVELANEGDMFDDDAFRAFDEDHERNEVM